ncbi:hypothetical protein [Metallosphaera hakonensis]|uniref:Uncharacterized protein n=1 Tax=Metallosphaera hakonensis JCM 8857 = DSM 7519 TaxID=1293036 RepID=A0A2U9IR72_9CREN|nr:hypothetical protein [Metallosphaera hakonensis]AWR98549.1 hypothetical protein DFR87_01215 [Metallosphaera hakonensis JCM 8857 = DSM 7519]
MAKESLKELLEKSSVKVLKEVQLKDGYYAMEDRNVSTSHSLVHKVKSSLGDMKVTATVTQRDDGSLMITLYMYRVIGDKDEQGLYMIESKGVYVNVKGDNVEVFEGGPTEVKSPLIESNPGEEMGTLLRILTKGSKENEMFAKFFEANGSKGLSDISKKTNFRKVT